MCRPLPLVDVDGVISLFGLHPIDPPLEEFRSIDGVVHFLSGSAGRLLQELAAWFELVWCTSPNRPLAWIDDAFDQDCERWAAARSIAPLASK
ncbi:MAG: hypothetical protein ACYDHH_12095 [Solirubrobacteraceae bacterium]